MVETSAHIKSQWLPWLVISLFVLLFGLSVTIVSGLGLGFAYIRSYIQTAGFNPNEMYEQVKLGFEIEPKIQDGVKNFLILGTDEVANRDSNYVLTDTMMLLSVDLNTGTINMLSLPRDLWNEEYQTKLNALYFYGKERYPESPEQFPTEVISSMTGLTIHHTIVVSLDTLGMLIDSVGGIPITVEHGFTDTEFPRSDVDITSGNPDELYETVVFTPGEERMNSTRALQYIRSRKSGDDEGTDIARGRRQQQVIQALAQEILSVNTFTNPERLGRLYRLYQDKYASTLPLSELVATARLVGPDVQSLTFNQHGLSIYPDDPNGVILHPDPRRTNDIWVYQIRDEVLFKDEVQSKLGII